MSSEMRLEEIFDSAAALLERGQDPQGAISSAIEAIEILPMVEIVREARALPRYFLPAATFAALNTSLTAQLLGNPQPYQPIDQPPAQPAPPPTPPPMPPPTRPRNWSGWTLPGKLQLALIGAVLVVLVTVVVLVITLPSSSPLVRAGTLEEVGQGYIVVDGQRILTDASTVFNLQDVKPGQAVRVEVKPNAGGQLLALSVGPAPLPTVTALPGKTILPTQSPQPPPSASPLPTVTPMPSVTPTAIPTLTPAPTTTLPPTPVSVEVEGVVQNITIVNNLTVVVINNLQYVMLPDLVTQLGPSLKIGLRVKFKGNRYSNGSIVIVNLTVVNPAPIAPGNDEDKGKKDKEKDKPDDKGKGNDDKKPKK